MSLSKKRIDEWLVEKGMATNLKLAAALVLSGNVIVNDQRVSKASQLVEENDQIRFKKGFKTEVGRGFQKLKGALQFFDLEILNRTCLDLGASTGGFTECLLTSGALKIYAVDVGTNQLDWKLRNDQRVICLEKTHAKALSNKIVPEPIDFLTADVSFISLEKVLPFTWPLLSARANQLVLFKPQFECPRQAVNPGGIVSSQFEVDKALQGFQDWATEKGFTISKPWPCKLPGKDSGNQEYFFLLNQNN